MSRHIKSVLQRAYNSKTIGTQSHNLHRLRRNSLNPFFSKKSVVDLLPAIQRPVYLLCKRLRHASTDNETVNMKYIFAAVTLDIINDYCFSREPENVLKEDFGRKSFDNVDSFLEVSLMVGAPPQSLQPSANSKRIYIFPGLCVPATLFLYVQDRSQYSAGLIGKGLDQQDSGTCHGRDTRFPTGK